MNIAIGSNALQRGTCQLLALNKFAVSQWLKTFDTVLFDGDGVLWNRQEAIKGAPQTFNAIRAMGKNAFVCSNHSATSRRELCQRARQMGLLISEDGMISSAATMARYLQERKFQRKVYIVGEQGIAEELLAAGIKALPLDTEPMLSGNMQEHVKAMHMEPNVGAVVVGVDKHFSTRKLAKACSYLMDPSVLFLATNRDRSFPISAERHVPDADVMVSSIQAVVKRKPFTCGKPNPYMCSHLIRNGVIKPERTLMIGDTLYTDIQFGYNCGFQTLMVGTGVSSLADVKLAEQSAHPLMYQRVPNLYLPSLGDLLKFLPSRNG
ncbi:CG5577 [Drosophila busckii]|uniref:CG5577 n=1 Tax=Drosophila busckii TaxID=30019 RepID=A0A0M4EC97_DROBS|nr:pyridoxal phosphate phosphatase [Drosophila busckii]ALC43008.1 CG5577 [Drosophila busckii]